MNPIKKVMYMLVLLSGLVFYFGNTVHASKPDVDFIDVSHYNNENGLSLAFYQTIKISGVKGVVVKVSEGTYYTDPASSVNIANAKQAGLIVSAYHFARYTSNSSARAEARWFDRELKQAGFEKDRDGYAVLDIEADTLPHSPEKLTEYTNTFISEMKKLGYSRIDLYSSTSFYNNRLDPQSLAITSPWLAAFPPEPVKDHPSVHFSNGRGAWQWSEEYVFQGMSAFGPFDVSEDYAGKYTSKTASSQVIKDGVGKINSLSLVDYLKSKGKPASFSSRVSLAKKYGISNYTGTASQNLALLSKLKSGMKPAAEVPFSTKFESSGKRQTSIYTVKKGDTLTQIAKESGTTISRIQMLNHIQNPDFILAGQKLVLSSNLTLSAASAGASYYKVNRGDTLSGIAAKYGTTVSKLRTINRIQNPNVIFAGQTIKLTSGVGTANEYTVKRGDTLSGIAVKYKTTVTAIKRLNHLSSNTIHPSQVLLLE